MSLLSDRCRSLSLRFGVGLSSSVVLALGLAGCGSGGKSDTAVVLPSEPMPTNTTAPTGGGGATAPAPAATTNANAESTAKAPAAAPASGGEEGWGTLKGRVVFNGNPPEPKVLDTKAKDPEVCAKTPVKSERLVVNGGSKGVKNALVYIPKPTKVNPEARSNAEKATVEFDQKQCTFVPHVLAAMKGAGIALKSSDPVNHNINAKLRTNAPYNSLLTPNQSIKYDAQAAERGPVEVTCDIHPWMKAYWLILDNPYFAVTDENGNFEIKNAPAGAQKVVVWQEAVGYVTATSGESISIKANDTTTMPDAKIEPGKVKPE